MINEEFLGKGGVLDKVDERDISYGNIAMGTEPFDWSKGYDIEVEVGKAIGNPNFKIKAKDQNGSSSCGGQAWGYYGACIEALATGTYEERSAKFIYAQTHVPGGGSAGRDNCQLVINQGWAKESVCSSYQAGNPPSEQFIQNASDITPEARNDASKAKGLVYSNVVPDIDLIAKAVRDNGGLVIGVYGKNNGTWISPYPKPPLSSDMPNTFWAHWLYVGKVKMENGKKFIGVINSWGEDVGEDGWQWLGEEYFKSVAVIGSYIFSVWTLVYKGSDPEFHHTFTQNLKKGSSGDEVQALQKALTLEGMFKGVIDGKFGAITEASVKVFQTRYSLGVDGKVGPKTNAKLNQIYSK